MAREDGNRAHAQSSNQMKPALHESDVQPQQSNVVPPQLAPELSAFESIKHLDDEGHEYWLARELAKLLGYAKWEHFERRVIAEAIAVCAQEGEESIALNFRRIEKGASATGAERIFPATGKNTSGRKRADFRLTRHACYVIAESADGRKDEVAWAKIYFAFTTERYELLAQTEEERARIMYRQKLLLHNSELALRARIAGAITRKQYADFFNRGYFALYAGETAEDIRIRKGLPPGAEIQDWMGAVESAANDMRAALTLHHIDQRGVTNLPEANAIHYKVGQDVRAFLITQDVYPERLPTPTKSFQQLLKEQALRERLAAEDREGLWSLLPAEDEAADDVDTDEAE